MLETIIGINLYHHQIRQKMTENDLDMKGLKGLFHSHVDENAKLGY